MNNRRQQIMNTRKKPSFQEAFVADLGRALSNNDVVVLEAATLPSGNEKSQEWASALSAGLISYENKIKEEHSFVLIKSEPYGQVLVEIKNDHRNIHKFMIRIVQKAHQVKQFTWLTSKSFLFNPRDPKQFDSVSNTINREWTEKIQTHGADWDEYPVELIHSWKREIFNVFMSNLQDKTSQHYFLDLVLGKEDTYWVAKKPRAPVLIVAPVNRTGRLRMGDEYLKPLAVEGSPEILNNNGDLYLEIPLNNQMTLRGFVESHYEKQGLGIKVTWFLFGKAEYTLSI